MRPPSPNPTRRLAACTVAATAVALAALGAGAPAYAAKPELAIYSSAGDAPASGTVTVTALVSRTARKVSFYVDGRKRTTDRSAPWSIELDTSELSPGQHTIAARVRGRGWRAGAWRTILVAGDSALTPTVAGLPELKPRPKKKARGKGRRRTSSRPRRPRAPRPVKPAPPLPAPVAPAIPPRGPAEFVGDFDTGNLSQWALIQRAATDRIRAVTATDSGAAPRQGSHMGRFEIRDGGSEERSEVTALHNGGPNGTLEAGSEDYIGFSTRWESNFVCPPTGLHSLFLQPKAGEGSPTFSLENRGCETRLRDAGDHTVAPLARDVWHDFVVHVRWSTDPAVGFIRVYHKLATDPTYVKRIDRGSDTLNSNGAAYFKLGYYRNTGVTGTSVIYHDGLRIGKAFGSVAP